MGWFFPVPDRTGWFDSSRNAQARQKPRLQKKPQRDNKKKNQKIRHAQIPP